jgi:hypothetical protein
LDELKAAIQKSCADPKLTVPFYSCFVGETNGLAKQLAELGVNTEGYSGSCTFPKDKDTGEYLLPGGKDGAEIKKFPAIGGGGGEFKKPERLRRREPRETFGENISRVITGTDGETWCTYGDGVEFETVLIATDENGTEVETTEIEETTSGNETETKTKTKTGESEASESAQGESYDSVTVTEATPATPVTAEAVPEETTTTPETPPTAEKVPEQPTTPETPTTAEKPEEPTTPETPTTTEKPEEPTTPETPTTTEKPEEPTSEIPDTIFVKPRSRCLRESLQASRSRTKW